MRRQRLRHLPLLYIALTPNAYCCSFLVANFDVKAGHTPFETVNYYNQKRGPDATNVFEQQGWAFVHNLLSMTGTVTKQPFVSSDGSVVALFNGEIYNYRSLAKELAGSESAYVSDGYSLLPAYAKWGCPFVQHLEGEFAVVLVDFARGLVVLSTDVFSTKPLWYALWDDPSGPRESVTRSQSSTGTGKASSYRFVAASYESVLKRLGAPASSRRMADPNEALILRLPGHQPPAGLRVRPDTGDDALDGLELIERLPLVRWDLRQHKTHTRDWATAFRAAVATRTANLKHRVFIGLSSGYDSGAIMLALKQQGKPFLAYSVAGTENASVVDGRRAACADVASTVAIHGLEGERFEQQRARLQAVCEPFRYWSVEGAHSGERRGRLVTDDNAAVGLSAILSESRPTGGLICAWPRAGLNPRPSG